MDLHENLSYTIHSVLTGCVIIFEMSVSPSLFIKLSIYTCRTDMCQIIMHIHQKITGQIDILKSYMKRQVIEIVIRCGMYPPLYWDIFP